MDRPLIEVFDEIGLLPEDQPFIETLFDLSEYSTKVSDPAIAELEDQAVDSCCASSLIWGLNLKINKAKKIG